MMKSTILGLTILAISFSGCTTSQEGLHPNGKVIYLGDIQKKDSLTSLYTQEQSQLTRELIKTPPVPIKTPNTILTLLFYPYDNEGVLVGHFYAFMEINDGKWVIGSYLDKQKASEKIITPLSLDLKKTNPKVKKEDEEKSEPTSAQQGIIKIPTTK